MNFTRIYFNFIRILLIFTSIIKTQLLDRVYKITFGKFFN